MLSGQGWTAIAGCRQFFYARSVNMYVVLTAQAIKSLFTRYADWIVSFPLLILLLGIVAAADTASIGAGIGAVGKAVLPCLASFIHPSAITTVKPKYLRSCLHLRHLHGQRLRRHHRQVVLVLRRYAVSS